MDSKKINSIYDFSDKGLVELKSWLEPWFLTRRGEDGGSTVGTNHDLIAVIDGVGAAITIGVKGEVRVDFNATILGWTLLADQSGSIVVDIWKDTYANFPPTVGDTITASAKPTLASAQKNTDTTLTGWTTTITDGDTLRFNVDSATTVTRVALIIHLQES